MNTETKHTPGPWNIRNKFDGAKVRNCIHCHKPIETDLPGYVQIIGAAGMYGVATINWPFEDKNDEQQAFINAKLIASAPDMAEELAKLRPLVGELNAAIGIRDKQLDTLRADKAELVEACKFVHRYHVMQEQKETGHDFPPQLANTLSALLSKHSTQGSK